MKKFKIIFLLTVIPILFYSTGCEKEIEEPDGCYTLSIKQDGEIVILTEPYSVEAGVSIFFENCGMADFYSFFSGKPGHVYAEYTNPADTTSTGVDTNSTGDVSVSYPDAGEYTATMLLTNRTVGDPHNAKQVAMNFDITVTEPVE